MDRMRLALSFFSDLLRIDEKKIDFVILQIKDCKKGKTIRHPAIRIECLVGYVFDIKDGGFKKLGLFGDINTVVDLADVVIKDDHIVFWNKRGFHLEYTWDEFFLFYSLPGGAS